MTTAGEGVFVADPLRLVAITPAGGIPLINGTQNLMTWTAPNDGKQHAIYVAAVANITVTEVGGTVVINYTIGGQNGQPQLLAGSTGGPQLLAANQNAFVVDPGTTVTIIQSTALTGGTAVFFGAILAQ